MGFNTSTGNQVVELADGASLTSNSVDASALVGKPANGDFVTAYTSATTLTLSSLPEYITAVNDEDIVSVVQINASGAVVDTFTKASDTITVASNVITVADATFGATDTFIVYTNIPRAQQSIAGYDEETDANNVFVINQESNKYAPLYQNSVTNETNDTTNRPLDVQGYNEVIVHFEKTGGTDTVTLTVEGTAQDDGTALASCAFVDITQYGTTCYTAAAAASFTVDAILHIDVSALKGINVKTVSTGGANDADYSVFVRAAA